MLCDNIVGSIPTFDQILPISQQMVRELGIYRDKLPQRRRGSPVKILTVSDEECAALWDNYVPGRLKEYDLILSCGDLSARYLSFLVTMARCPLLYVHGNHDTNYKQVPPEGCDCIDDHIGDL